jgi:hypothetical protein
MLVLLSCTEKSTNSPATDPAPEDQNMGMDTGTALDCGSGESVTAYVDSDEDGYGRAYTATEMCLPLPDGYVTEMGDCRDHYPEVYPGADEYCDGLDNDCDGTTDEDPLDPDTHYLDEDFDGWGNSELSLTGCNLPDGYVPYGGDCDDNDPDRAPANDELCDGIDNDCNGIVDDVDPDDATIWYLDEDGDGHGSTLAPGIVKNCTQPEGSQATATDCDDTDPEVYNGAFEVCDGKDNDCDPYTVADEGCP